MSKTRIVNGYMATLLHGFNNYSTIQLFNHSKTRSGKALHRMVRGFTLIEILVAIAMIGILSGVVVGLLNPSEQFKRTRDAGRKSDLSQLQSALALYYADHGGYPPATGAAGDQIDWGSSSQKYIAKLPQDPLSAQKYSYQLQPDGTYKLFARLENCSDQQANAGTNCSSDPYNYCASPNGPCLIASPTPAPTVTPTPAPTSVPTPIPTPVLVRIQGSLVDWNAGVSGFVTQIVLDAGEQTIPASSTWSFAPVPPGNHVINFVLSPLNPVYNFDFDTSICFNCTSHPDSSYSSHGLIAVFDISSGMADIAFRASAYAGLVRACGGPSFANVCAINARVFLDTNQNANHELGEVGYTHGAQVKISSSSDGINWTPFDALHGGYYPGGIVTSDANGCYTQLYVPWYPFWKVEAIPPYSYISTSTFIFSNYGSCSLWRDNGDLGIFSSCGDAPCPTPIYSTPYSSPYSTPEEYDYPSP